MAVRNGPAYKTVDYNCKKVAEYKRRRNIQHADIRHNDTQHNDILHNGLICDTQHNDTRHKHKVSLC